MKRTRRNCKASGPEIKLRYFGAYIFTFGLILFIFSGDKIVLGSIVTVMDYVPAVMMLLFFLVMVAGFVSLFKVLFSSTSRHKPISSISPHMRAALYRNELHTQELLRRKKEESKSILEKVNEGYAIVWHIDRKTIGCLLDRPIGQDGKVAYSLGPILNVNARIFATAEDAADFLDQSVPEQWPDSANGAGIRIVKVRPEYTKTGYTIENDYEHSANI